MCGILGVIYAQNLISREEFQHALLKMKHRGPDGHSIFKGDGIFLGHTLLTIQSDIVSGVQPYKYNNIMLVFNGEIFNKSELRAKLLEKDILTLSDTDTEIIVKMIYHYGNAAFEYFDGFFAISYFNIDTKECFLARDRLGIKPLYYYLDSSGNYIFGSEIKPILDLTSDIVNFNYSTLLRAIFFQLWMDPKLSYFGNIRMLEPGTIFSCKTGESSQFFNRNKYILEKKLDTEVALERLKTGLTTSVKKNLTDQYPVACLLSGGIDSSLVTMIYSSHNEKTTDVFTTIYDDCENPDFFYAKKLAEGGNMNHIPILVGRDDYSLDNIDTVTIAMEEIMIDKVYIPMYVNFRTISEHGYRIALSGQGADEVWAGYYNTWKIYRLPEDGKLKHESLVENYLSSCVFRKYLLNENIIDLGKIEINEQLSETLEYDSIGLDSINLISQFAEKTILHNLLLQEDKLSMAHGIECRVPFIDSNQILEIALSTSGQFKILDGREKYPVRQVAKGILPDIIINREKYPFPESPGSYNEHFRILAKSLHSDLINSRLLQYLIREEILLDLSNFNDKEIWWLISISRFEKVFGESITF